MRKPSNQCEDWRDRLSHEPKTSFALDALPVIMAQAFPNMLFRVTTKPKLP